MKKTVTITNDPLLGTQATVDGKTYNSNHMDMSLFCEKPYVGIMAEAMKSAAEGASAKGIEVAFMPLDESVFDKYQDGYYWSRELSGEMYIYAIVIITNQGRDGGLLCIPEAEYEYFINLVRTYEQLMDVIFLRVYL